MLLFGAVAAQYLRQVLGKRRTRHDGIAPNFQRLHFQLALQVRDEAHDGSPLLQLRLQLGDGGQRLGAGVVEVEDDQRRLLLAGLDALQRFLLGLDELHLHVELARRLLDLGAEEEVVDEGEDAGAGILAHRQRLDLGMLEESRAAAGHRPGTEAVAAAAARSVASALLVVAIAVVHGTDEGSAPPAAPPRAAAGLSRICSGAMLAPTAASSPSGKVWLVHVPRAAAVRGPLSAFLVSVHAEMCTRPDG